MKGVSVTVDYLTVAGTPLYLQGGALCLKNGYGGLESPDLLQS